MLELAWLGGKADGALNALMAAFLAISLPPMQARSPSAMLHRTHVLGQLSHGPCALRTRCDHRRTFVTQACSSITHEPTQELCRR